MKQPLTRQEAIEMMEKWNNEQSYRGFDVWHDREGIWAGTERGTILLGPFTSLLEALKGIDQELA